MTDWEKWAVIALVFLVPLVLPIWTHPNQVTTSKPNVWNFACTDPSNPVGLLFKFNSSSLTVTYPDCLHTHYGSFFGP